MNSGSNRGTTSCHQVQSALSDYLKGGLPPPGRKSVEDHLAGCEACALEERELSKLLTLFREQVPHREPALDIWAELGPKVVAHMAEEKMSIPARLQLRANRFWSSVAMGAIQYTQVLALSTETRLRKYLIQEPFHLAEEER